MNPRRVLVSGIHPSTLVTTDAIMWIVKGPKNADVTESEHYLANKKMMESVHIFVIDFQENNPSFADGVLMQMAYSMSTPIFVVGQGLEVPEFWKHLFTRQCDSMSDLVDHLQAYYC